MRNNKAILDEAVRSVRRTFIGSVAGTVGMLAVVGAAGAYGMPEKLTAHAFTLALSSLISPAAQRQPAVVAGTASAVDRVVKVAENVTQRDVMPVVEPAAPPRAPVVRTMPELPLEPAPAPVPQSPVTAPQETPAALPQETAMVSSPAVVPVAPMKIDAPDVEPAPAQVMRIAPTALPPSPDDRQVVPAPLVFETPKPDAIPPLAEMPRLEPVAPSAAAEPAKPVTKPVPQEQTKAVEMAPAELPKTVSVLPPPKPPLSPAQRLDLQGKDYDKAEKCLAQAVYFEARNEAVRGQQAVAQVVLNRVFSPYYPKDICSVVYQNAHRHLSCQFTFACDGKPETIRERGAWARASRIAKQTLNAQVWLPEVDKATHYHASYVHPRWVRDMKVMVRYGIHTFYRPRNWGDGSNEPHWGTAANSAKPAVTVAAVSAKHHAAPAAKRALLRRTASLR
jgi:spore germination cell wall hydrolase CwlJ-like protein